MRVYESDHIYLKKACANDILSMYQNIWSDKNISKYMNFKPIDNLYEAEVMMRQSIEHQKNNISFFVYDRYTDEAIGFAGVKKIANSDYSESGLCIARKFQGRGYGKELLLLLLNIVFNELHGERFMYSTMKENVISIKLCTSCGFVYDSSKIVIRKWDNYQYINDSYIITSQQYHEQRI